MNKVLKEEVKHIGVHPDLKNALEALKPMGMTLRDMGELVLNEFFKKSEEEIKGIVDRGLSNKHAHENAEKKRVALLKYEADIVAIDQMHPVAA